METGLAGGVMPCCPIGIVSGDGNVGTVSGTVTATVLDPAEDTLDLTFTQQSG